MMTILRNILAFVLGVILGGVVNMAIVIFVSPLVPLPEGVIPDDMESIKANIHRFSFWNLLVPFAAHALGTLVGAFVAAALAKSYKLPLALGIGALTMVGGIAAIAMIGGPVGFMIADLGLAYIPMAWIGGKLGMMVSQPNSVVNPTA